MWKNLASNIIKFRIAWLLIILCSTIFMAYYASKIELSYQIARILPSNDPVEQHYEKFRKLFGQDGAVMVIGWKDSNLFEYSKFRDWFDLQQKIESDSSIKGVMSIASLYKIHRNDSLHKFDIQPLLVAAPKTQAEVDSLKASIENLPFYQGLVINKTGDVTLMAITFNEKDLNSAKRIGVVQNIEKMMNEFASKHSTEVHFSGMPYIRTATMKKVSHEMQLFMGLAVLVTGFILWFFIRSVRLTVLSIGIVLIGVIFSIGSLVLFGYKITILTGLIPPLLIVIGVPNCIFLINRYLAELKEHGDKQRALDEMVGHMGLSILLANTTTAIGFGVFYFTNSSLLVEFGVIAALNVMLTFLLCLVLLTITLFYMDKPKTRHMNHLDGKWIENLLNGVNNIVLHHRKTVYAVMLAVILISAYGMTKIKVLGYVVDDLPKKDQVYTDLHFLEKNFNGILPFEVLIDTKQPNGVLGNGAKTLYKIRAFQNEMAKHPEFSKPISITEATRFLYQGFRGGDKKYFVLPGALELNKMIPYLENNQSGAASKQIESFLNQDKSVTRISFQMADVGSIRIKELLAEIQPKLDSIFSPKEYDASLTGHSLVFLKSNDYLLGNLYESLLIAIVLIAIVGMVLFRSVPVILLSKLPCLIPLALTAGIMGFAGIPFKPSTILVFSITFGIASDGTVYFLTRFRQELAKKGNTVYQAITSSIYGTGHSMVYTAVILFCGFAIFAGSSFGGTKAMGVMVSVTLLVAMCTNLILLPSLMISISNWQAKRRRNPKEAL